MNYYPFHIGDFNNATRHLTRIERSVYRDLLDLYYDTESAIPESLDDIARRILVRSKPERAALGLVLSEFFTLIDGLYRNKRADEEIAKYRVKSELASLAGKASATSRRNRAKTSVERPLNERATNQEPETKNQNQVIPPTPPAGGKGFDWFADLPAGLDCSEFRAAWTNWVAYRKSIKRPLTLASAPAAFKKALEVGVPAAIKGFETSMANGWQAAFPTSPTTPQKPDHRAEKRSREYPENIVIPDFI
jgi:uncharacterized protein YdaU (DUF1376 family)